MADMSTRTSSEKIRIFRDLFTGLTNVYGTYNPSSGRSLQVKAPVDHKVIHAHLTGRQPYGVYLLVRDRTQAIAIDFDTKNQVPPMEFVARAKHYGISAYIERSKSKGHHVWIFFDEKGVLALKARLVALHILDEIGESETEIFPKQDALEGDLLYGNFINAPLFGRLVPRGKTVFIDPKTFNPYRDQWDFLESIDRVGEDHLDEIIELNSLSVSGKDHQSTSSHSPRNNQNGFGLPPCAQKMLRNGVSQYQRVSCFRLAIHLKKQGFPYDLAVAVLKTWALKNRPANGKGVIRESEILSQTSYAFKHTYAGYGCQSHAISPFCEPSCPVRRWRKEKEGDSSPQTWEKNGKELHESRR